MSTVWERDKRGCPWTKGCWLVGMAVAQGSLTYSRRVIACGHTEKARRLGWG